MGERRSAGPGLGKATEKGRRRFQFKWFNSESGLTSNRPSAETLSPAIFISLLLKSFVILSKGCIYYRLLVALSCFEWSRIYWVGASSELISINRCEVHIVNWPDDERCVEPPSLPFESAPLRITIYFGIMIGNHMAKHIANQWLQITAHMGISD